MEVERNLTSVEKIDNIKEKLKDLTAKEDENRGFEFTRGGGKRKRKSLKKKKKTRKNKSLKKKRKTKRKSRK